MAGKIFVNYRRDDERAFAARVRDRLAQSFGGANVFMDVDNLMAGQRFDKELQKALAETDIFLAVIGPRWMDLYRARQASGERDYVHEEIAGALGRGITVVPLLIEGAPMPRADTLPEDIRALVLHQKHGISHENFGRDVAGLIEAIQFTRKSAAGPVRRPVMATAPWGWIGATAAGVLAIGYAGAYSAGVPVWVPWQPPPSARVDPAAEAGRRAAEAAKVKADADRLADAEAKVLAAQEAQRNAEAKSRQLADAADKARRDQEARDKAAREEAARKKAEDEVRAKAEAEQKRLAALKAEEDRKAAAAETKRLADLAAAEERRKAQAMSPGRVFRDCPDKDRAGGFVCPEMVVVPAGSFTMGSNDYDDEKPPHQVTIGRAFAVAKFEVTFDEWEACVAGGGCTGNRSPSDQGWGKGRRPVINVSWNDAKEYASWLSRKTGQTYRLLTEAEWEYAARGGKGGLKYWWGDQASHEYANYGSDSCCSGLAQGRDQWVNTAPVGQFPGNPFGLHDMHGNVWEWVEDCYASNYNGAPTDGSVAKVTQDCSRVFRGGSWNINPVDLRSANRVRNTPGIRYNYLGLRLARTINP